MTGRSHRSPRSRLGSGLVAALVGAVVVLLTACAGLPSSGPVNIGRAVVDDDSDLPVVFIPNAPAAGMTPQQVVEGFIAAGSGTQNTWAIAKQFLTEEFREEWNPRAAVTIYAPGDREIEVVSDEEVLLTVTPEASVDANGSYTVVTDSGEITTEYHLVQEGGEWRIAQAPDGIVLDRSRFLSVFRSYSLMYFDPTWTYLVPDQRWFPTENLATLITRALVDGQPSPWLAESVVTAFTESTGLAGVSVPVVSEVAQVTLTSVARAVDQIVLDRMQTQLEKSLETAGISGVQLNAGGQALDATAVPVQSTRVDSRALVQIDEYFGFLSGDAVESIPGLSVAVIDAQPDAVEVRADRTSAAIRTGDGRVGRADDDAQWNTYDSRESLLAPTIDTEGYVYAVPEDEPAAVIAYGTDGAAHEVTGAWPASNQIVAMRVSRDGTRVAAIVRQGMRTSVQVAGIVRDNDGVPVSFGPSVALTIIDGEGIDLIWTDDRTLAVSYTFEGTSFVREQPVGEPGSQIRARIDVVAIAAGAGSGTVRLLDASGALYVQQGATWLHAASDIRLLAVQQGMPR